MALPNCCRPLQIVHNICLLCADSGDFHPGLQALADQGIGGIVTNVPFANYLTDESAWNTLRACLSACRDLGLRVWIYDEKGYPSGAAGGRVLANHPDLEAVALYYDAAKDCLYADRSYEGTHNCRNFHAWRRTINLLEPEAVAEFIRVTHAQYAERLGPEFNLVEAFFTDEPALNVLPMPEITNAVNPIPVDDPPNRDRIVPPAAPWSRALSCRWKGTDLRPLFRDEAGSGALRRRFYEGVADDLSDTFFGGLARWCRRHNVYSSGHLLWEEDPVGHPALYGNLLRCMMQLDIPGIDILTSDPAAGWRGSAVAVAFAASAAMLRGTRRIMTEASDIAQRWWENRLPAPDEVAAALAWQAALGVTDFTYYYEWGACPELPSTRAAQPLPLRAAADSRRYNDAIASLTAELLPARLKPDVFLYYPIELLQAAYQPQTEPWATAGKPPELERIAASFLTAFRGLLDAGIIPCFVDGALLRRARQECGPVHILAAEAAAVVVPEGCRPPDDCLPAPDVKLLAWENELPERLFQAGQARLLKDNANIAAGVMERAEKPLITLVNLTPDPQRCRLRTQTGASERELKPFEAAVQR